MNPEELGLGEAGALFVARQRVAHLATTYPDGRPHVVPISPVLEEDRLLFASERKTQKVRNIEGDPRAAVCFDEYTEVWDTLRQVVLHGTARFIEGGPDFAHARALLYDKYRQYETDAPIEEAGSVIIEVRCERAYLWGL